MRGNSQVRFLGEGPAATLAPYPTGDILNISINAIHAGSADADPAKWKVTQAMLEREIEKARAANVEHSGKKRTERRVIGFGGEKKSCRGPAR